ncbi:MAG: hypothetical protein RM338_04620 [Nostoc sp. DedQUE12a]|nr:hypothetical protein [Nostoc sp. DedQUE12a]
MSCKFFLCYENLLFFTPNTELLRQKTISGVFQLDIEDSKSDRTMDDSKALFDYWHDRVRLKNHELIADTQHVPTQKLRHECTNYDELRSIPEVQQLDELERSRVIAVIKYECTAKVLQNRAGRLRDRAHELEVVSHEQDQQKSKLLGLINALREKLFGKDKEIKKLEARKLNF